MRTQVSFDRLVVNEKMIYCDLDRYDAGKVSLFCRVLYAYIDLFSCVYRSLVLGLFVCINIVNT